MAISNTKPTTPIPLNDKKLNEFQWDAEAHRVVNVDSSGTIIDNSNPSYVTITDGTNNAAVDSLGQLHVVMQGIADANNSTDTPLSAGGTFTGTTHTIFLSADFNNTGNLFVGKSDVTSAGSNAIIFLQPGEKIELKYEDGSNPLYVVSDTASQYFWKGALL